jgi:hypothetical protein
MKKYDVFRKKWLLKRGFLPQNTVFRAVKNGGLASK